MTLIYVCTDYDLSGPTLRERARIGLLLTCLYSHLMEIEEMQQKAMYQPDIDKWAGEHLFVKQEISNLCQLLPDRTEDEVISELKEEYNG